MKLKNVKTLDTQTLWQLVLTPEENAMPEHIKQYLKESLQEFNTRNDYILTPIMDCNYY